MEWTPWISLRSSYKSLTLEIFEGVPNTSSSPPADGWAQETDRVGYSRGYTTPHYTTLNDPRGGTKQDAGHHDCTCCSILWTRTDLLPAVERPSLFKNALRVGATKRLVCPSAQGKTRERRRHDEPHQRVPSDELSGAAIGHSVMVRADARHARLG